ncbi:hemophore-related protein [Mycobacterium botniense]|uniref:Hemophore-related protein n=1 Tax=Mycobacterium botniense TaxID=84962 RepID=A0A7I9Y1U4_9MYCO|nr:hemophore-related protein [Mycobacterium botniense]GFG76039.1 hypothetical protein MBOT_34040 [Mycobacterium botniense]
MTKLLTRLPVAVGALVVSVTAGIGVASADPGMDQVINTTCSYSQAVAALNAQDPAAAAQFNASPVAQSWLRTFLDSPPDQRQRMIQQVQSMPRAQQYAGLVVQIANTCNNY